MAASVSLDPTAPFFPFDATVRRIHREGVLILGGGRALLMQIAHPAVALGVAEHSSYRVERRERLLRTLRSTLAMVYGTRQQAEAAIARINGLHRDVKGAGYNAMDPDLLVWVLATLIDTTIEMHERFIGPIDAKEAAGYYREVCQIGRLLGIPEGTMPEDLPALRAYVEQMSATLIVSSAARAIAAELLAPLPGTGPAMLVLGQLTSGLLDPSLRRGYGLGWGPMREAELRTLQSLSRLVLPKTPLALRRTPAFLLPAS